MSTRREILGKLNVRKRCKTFLPPMLEMPLVHVSGDKNYFIDVGFVMRGFPQIVYIFDNIDYEPLKMDIYKLQNHSCFVDIEYSDDEKEVIVYLDVPKEFRKDFDKFVQGRYTEFSDKYKDILTKKYGEGRQEGINPKNGLPNVSVYDVIYPESGQKQILASALGSQGSNVNWQDIKEVISPPDIEAERFKTIEELQEDLVRFEDMQQKRIGYGAE